MVTVFENFKENIDWRIKWNLSELHWLREFCVTTVFGNAKLSHPYAHPRMTDLFCIEMHYLNLLCTKKNIEEKMGPLRT